MNLNNDLISRSALLKFWFEIRDRCVPELVVDCMIKEAPSVDAVSPGVLEQYKWERDTAIAQLEELGLGFGEKVPEIQPVRHGVWMFPWTSPECSICRKTQKWTSNYCPNCGAKMDAEVDG